MLEKWIFQYRDFNYIYIRKIFMVENTGGGLNQATDYEFIRFDVITLDGQTFDILPIIALTEIFEDMETPFIKGNVGIRDALGFVNKHIKGGERLSISFKTQSASDTFTFTKEFIVYEISRREQSKPKEILWQIEFVSEEYVNNIDNKISRSFKNKKSYQIIESILNTDLKSTKNFIFEEDNTEQTYVTPYQHPLSTIKFFKERSLNSENHASYFFYENRDGYVFKSLAELENQEPTNLYYKPDGVNTKYPKFNIVEDYFPTDTAYDNIIENKKGGLEGTFGTFLNLNDKRVITQGDVKKSQFFSIYSSDQDNNSRNWLQNRNMNMTRFNSIIYNLMVAGSTLRTVGDLIYFNLPSAKSYGTEQTFEEDEKLSGLWIIKRIKHSLEGNVYQQVLEVSKVQENLIPNQQTPENNLQETTEYDDVVERNTDCTPMRLSEKGRLEIFSHEGIVLNRYLDSVGVWTIGIGITRNAGASINPDNHRSPITINEAINLFNEVIGRYEKGVNDARNCTELKQHEFDALVSLAFNVGANLGPDTRRLIQAGKVPDAIDLWQRPASIRGRRRKEIQLAITGNYTARNVLVSNADENGTVLLSESRSVPIEDLSNTGTLGNV